MLQAGRAFRAEHEAAVGDSGVVDEQGDVGSFGCGGGNLVRVGDVERQRLDDGGVSVDEVLHRLRIPGGGVDLLGAGLDERFDVGAADAAIGSRDESDGALDFERQVGGFFHTD